MMLGNSCISCAYLCHFCTIIHSHAPCERRSPCLGILGRLQGFAAHYHVHFPALSSEHQHRYQHYVHLFLRRRYDHTQHRDDWICFESVYAARRCRKFPPSVGERLGSCSLCLKTWTSVPSLSGEPVVPCGSRCTVPSIPPPLHFT